MTELHDRDHDIHPHVEPKPSAERTKRWYENRLAQVAVGVGALVLAGTVGAGLKASGGDKNPNAGKTPDTTPSATTEVSPAAVDIIVKDKADLDKYPLGAELNPAQVFGLQDDVMNKIIAKLIADPTYRYEVDLSHIAEGEAKDQFGKVVQTVFDLFREQRQKLRDKGFPASQINELKVSVQTIPEGDPTTAGNAYKQNGLMSYYVSDKAGASAKLVENDYPVSYTYAQMTIGDPYGTSTKAFKQIFIADEFVGQF